MRLQGVFSDLQMFIGSLTTLQDPLTTLLLDPVAFTRTQATITSLIKKLLGLVHHYQVADLLPCALDKWPEEDAEDKAEDLAGIPLLIAKSRPTRAVLQKFEADCAQREQAELLDSSHTGNPGQDDRKEAGSVSSVSSRPPSSVSLANCGLSAAKRSQFLRFVYSQNPNLIASNETVDSAVAAGAVALSSAPSSSKPSIQSLGRGQARSQPRQSLVQQRISSFATSGDAVPPPPPSSINGLNPARRVASENLKNVARKSWAVDMSALDGIQRKSSLSISKPASQPGPTPQVSVAAPPVDWRSSISRSPSLRGTSLASVEPTESTAQSTPSIRGHLSSRSDASVSVDDESTPRPASQLTLAEQAAAIVAARKSRKISFSSISSVAQTQSTVSTMDRSEFTSPTRLPITPEHPLPSNHDSPDPPISDSPSVAIASTCSSAVAPPSSSSDSNITSDSTSSSQSTSGDEIITSNEPVTGLESPARSVILPSCSDLATPPNTASVDKHDMSSRCSPPHSSITCLHSGSSMTPPKSPAPILGPPSTRSLSLSRPPSVRRLSPLPPTSSVADLDFELVPNLIEHTSLLDVILTPTAGNTEDATSITSSETIASIESVPEVASVSTPEPPARRLPPPALTVISSSNHVKAASVDEVSLADLMEQASMFESWVPESEEPSLDSSQQQSLAPSSFTEPKRDFIEPKPAQSPPTVPSSASPSLSLSPASLAHSLPFVLNGVHSPTVSPSSPPFALPISSRPSLPSLQPMDQSLGALPEGSRSEAALTIAGSVSPTRSVSGQSWATSLMSSPPLASDFDERFLNGNNFHFAYPKGHPIPFIPSPEDPLKTGWRILCLDGGGVRGLSMLYAIRELMLSIQVRLRLKRTPLPYEMFEMICGVGTGGIIAILLGRLKLTVSLAIEAYLQIARQVFGQSKGVIATVRRKARYSASKLESVIGEVVKHLSGESPLPLYDPIAGTRCRTLIVFMKPSMLKGEGEIIRKLRSYHSRRVMADSCNIAQAARATSAVPPFFKPLKPTAAEESDSHPTDVSVHNPSLEVISEANELFPGRPIDCFISLGAGRGNSTHSGSIARACAEMADSCDHVARAVQAKSQKEGWSDNYFRLSVNGLRNDETRGEWEVPDLVKAGTVKYLFIDQKDTFDKQLTTLTTSWTRAYDDAILQSLKKEDHSGAATPRSAAFPSSRQEPFKRKDDLRRSISAELPELNAQIDRISLDSSYRMYKMSQASASTAKAVTKSSSSPSKSHPSSTLINRVGPLDLGSSEGSPSNLLLDLKLPDFTFSRT